MLDKFFGLGLGHVAGIDRDHADAALVRFPNIPQVAKNRISVVRLSAFDPKRNSTIAGKQFRHSACQIKAVP